MSTGLKDSFTTVLRARKMRATPRGRKMTVLFFIPAAWTMKGWMAETETPRAI